MPNISSEHNRRPIAARSQQWAKNIAAGLHHLGVWPNQVSVSSIFIVLAGGTGLLLAATEEGMPHLTLGLIGFCLAMQLRVVANMVDGMLAIEGGKTSAVGDLYNDVPDRVTDVLFFVGAGYALSWIFENGAIVWLGWILALGAVFTAYVRLLGGSVNVDQDFSGPFGKRERMFALTLFAAMAAIQTSGGFLPSALLWGMTIVTLGTYFTLFRRLGHISRALKERG